MKHGFYENFKEETYYMNVLRTEQHIIKQMSPCWKVVDDYCHRSKDLYNYANYLIRQEFIQNSKCLYYKDVFEVCKVSEPYLAIGSNVGQATLRMLDKTWKSFFKAIKGWKANPQKYLGRPKIPKYKAKDGRYVLGIDNIKFSIQDGFIRFSWKPLKLLNNRFRTKIPDGSKLIQCRFIPRGSSYVMEIVYEIEVPKLKEEVNNIASIDLGIDNFATITNNIGLKPIAIKGGVIKSMNQYYNKKKAAIQSELKLKNGRNNSKRLIELTAKRNRKVKHFMHVASKTVVDYCVQNNIDTLVCGYNPEWKQETNMHKKENQKFVAIPYEMFTNQIAYKCENVGIRFVLTEESYTSGTSFIDNEEPIKENYDKSRRKKRGLFVSNDGHKINADVNGSYQIMKKVFPNAFTNGVEGVGWHPVSMKIA